MNVRSAVCVPILLVLGVARPALPALGAPGDGVPAAETVVGLEGIYDTLDALDKATAPCVVVIDPTDPADVARAVAKPGGLMRLRRLEARVSALSGLDCYAFHYTQLRRDSLNRPAVKAIVLRAPVPAGMLKCEAAREELWAMLRESRIPTIAFCGGFHQVYLAFGGRCADMRPLQAGEADPHPQYAPGRLKEWGFCRVRVVKHDPLFEGLGDMLDVLEQHVSECVQLPSEFELLASTDTCRVQAIKHRERPLYATQFHPEAYEGANLDGKRLLQNFFRIAGAAGPLGR